MRELGIFYLKRGEYKNVKTYAYIHLKQDIYFFTSIYLYIL